MEEQNNETQETGRPSSGNGTQSKQDTKINSQTGYSSCRTFRSE